MLHSYIKTAIGHRVFIRKCILTIYFTLFSCQTFSLLLIACKMSAFFMRKENRICRMIIVVKKTVRQ
jgi:hypothetical protein